MNVKAYAKQMCEALGVQETCSLQCVFLSTGANLSAEGKAMFKGRESYASGDQGNGFETS